MSENFKPLENKSSMLISYFTLRKAVGILGIALPVLLLIGSYLIPSCGNVHKSISDYYHTPFRDVFVGILCAVSLFLFAYRGYDWRDNWAGNLGGLFALGVAFFPTTVTCPLDCNIPYEPLFSFASKIHFTSALLFFSVLIYFSLVLFRKSNTTFENFTIQKKKRNLIFKICGYTMVLCVLGIGSYFAFIKGDCEDSPIKYNVVFWLESIALCAFGISWLTKGELIWKDIQNKT